MKERRQSHISRVTLVGLLSLTVLISGCSALVTTEEEKRAQAYLLAKSQIWQREQETRLIKIALKIMKAAPEIKPLEFHLYGKPDPSWKIDPDSVNAWTDGSSVWVTRGMMRFIKSDDELAVILGHEMAHAYRDHMSPFRGQQLIGTLLGVGIAVGLAGAGADPQAAVAAGQVVASLATAKFNRDDEREADVYGMTWAYRAGFDIEAGRQVWERWAIEMPESLQQGFLASHPSSAERFVLIEKTAQELKPSSDATKIKPTPPPADIRKVEIQATAKKTESVQRTEQKSAIPKPPVSSRSVVVKRDGAKLYAERGDYSKVVTKLRQGEILEVLSQAFGMEDALYQVRTQRGTLGWVSYSDVGVKP